MDSLIRIVYIFIVYSFIVTATYFLLSSPIETIWTSFEDADFGAADDEKDDLMVNIRAAFTIFFALFLGIPLTWFVMKIFSREPAYYEYQRY